METSLKKSTPAGSNPRQATGAGAAESDFAIRRRGEGGRIRKAFVMQIRPAAAEEYQRRHETIWPEFVASLKAHGVHNYSIFRCESSPALFAYVEIENLERWEAVGRTEIGQLWRKHMSDLLVTHPDSSPVVTPLDEVFHLD